MLATTFRTAGRTAIVAAVLATAGPSAAAAQISVGAVLGVSRSSLSGDKPDKTSYSTRTGLIAGAVVEIPITTDVHLVFQPGFIQRGASIGVDVGEPDPVDSLDVKLDYLSLPVLIKIITNNRKLYVTSGIDIGYLSSATLTDGSSETDLGPILNDLDLSVIFGVGWMIPIGRPAFTIEMRYNQSLSNLNDTATTPANLPARFRSSGFQLLAGVLLPLGGGR